MNPIKIKSLRLKKTEEGRWKDGHPWIFSNEIQESPKAYALGDLVGAYTAQGEYLGLGMVNPHSLIFFRELSREKDEKSSRDISEIFRTNLLRALERRKNLGLTEGSFRLCFSDSDQIPGGTVDCFKQKSGWTVVIQVQTATLEHFLAPFRAVLEDVLQEFFRSRGDPETLSVIVDRSASVRTREGLTVQASELVSGALNNEPLLVNYGIPGGASAVVGFRPDFLDSQKTGFFLDQRDNVALVASALFHRAKLCQASGQKLKIADLFCFIGQWGLSVSALLLKQFPDLKIEWVAIDSSKKSLDQLEKSFSLFDRAKQITLKRIELDLFSAAADEKLKALDSAFDLVICDPPKLIKNRNDMGAGRQGYVKINSLAMGMLAPSGFLATLSCSHFLTREDLTVVIAKAQKRMRKQARVVQLLAQAADHPVQIGFPESEYLKGFLCQIENAP